jgi:sRNA-binding protein
LLRRWKMAATYCRAVLWCDHRIALDGTPAEPVDAEAKDLAAKQLAKLAARKAAKKTAKTAKPTSAPPPPPPLEPPKPLRDQIRASLLRRRSA